MGLSSVEALELTPHPSGITAAQGSTVLLGRNHLHRGSWAFVGSGTYAEAWKGSWPGCFPVHCIKQVYLNSYMWIWWVFWHFFLEASSAMELHSKDLSDSIFKFLQMRIMKCEYDKDVWLLGRICFPCQVQLRVKAICDPEHKTSFGFVCQRECALLWDWCWLSCCQQILWVLSAGSFESMMGWDSPSLAQSRLLRAVSRLASEDGAAQPL